MARYRVRYRGHQLVGGYKWQETDTIKGWLRAYFSAQMHHMQGWQQVEIKKEEEKK